MNGETNVGAWKNLELRESVTLTRPQLQRKEFRGSNKRNEIKCSWPRQSSCSWWPFCLRRESAAAQLLESRVRIPPDALMFMLCVL
jgi:hypothetical protein